MIKMSTQEKIVNSAVSLFIKQGVAKTTTKQIAKLAAVAEGSIYRYFPSKDELAWQVFKNYHEYLAFQLQASIEKDTYIHQKIKSLVSCFLKLADEDWLMFRYYLTSQHTHMDKVTKEMITPYRVLSNVVEQGMTAGEIKSADSNVITAMVVGAVHQIAINKVYSRIDGDLYDHRDLVSNTLMNMIKGDSHE